MIDQATVQKIKDTADIVEVVSDYVHLVRRGANYMGLCPFHNERTPSFSVNKARNFCYCFSCHKGGSPINFIMEKEGISYHDALLHLAKKYGIKVEEKELTDEERERQSKREGMYMANEWAMQYFEHNLHDTQDGKDIGLTYLYGRGVTDEAIRQFHLGYAIDRGSDFVQAARNKGFNVDVLKELGLVGTSQQGHDYDRFRGRVIFPIMNSSGKVIAFGGRDLKGGPAKYINSPESDVYKKNRELYGMYQARQAIVREDRCFLVEGYLDVIGMWQAGVKNVVASSGTSLTDGQIELIRRFTKNVTLIYDGDAAGIKAAIRGIDMFLSNGIDLNVLLLPDGDDPDSFARKHTPEEFQKYIKEHETDIIRFKAQLYMKDSDNNPMIRVEAVRSVVHSLACIPDRVKRDVYIQECSAILRVPETSIAQSVATERAKIVEELKRRRNGAQLERDIESGRIDNPGQAVATQAAPAIPVAPATQATPAAPAQTQPHPQSPALNFNPLRPMEWEVLEYCIKYGFLDFCDGLDPDGNKTVLNVIDFVYDELSADNISFSVPEYAEMFTTLQSMAPLFKQRLNEFLQDLENQKNDLRKKGFDEIASKDLSVVDIQREEERLEERVQAWGAEQLVEFSKSFPIKELASHENDVIRRLTTEALSEPHQLSHIYSRERPVEKEEDKLFNLLPTALTVWKNGIIERQFNELIDDLRRISGQGREEEEREKQARLVELMKIRSEVARNIGDRILCPKNSAMRTPRIYPKR